MVARSCGAEVRFGGGGVGGCLAVEVIITSTGEDVVDGNAIVAGRVVCTGLSVTVAPLLVTVDVDVIATDVSLTSGDAVASVSRAVLSIMRSPLPLESSVNSAVKCDDTAVVDATD